MALVRDIVTDEPTGIHRTALSADGSKIGPPQGPRLEIRRRDQAVFRSGIATELTIGEGLETTLSASMLGFGSRHGRRSTPASMSLFPVLPGISRLTIAVDNDVSGAGQARAKTRARWEAAGLRVRTVCRRRRDTISTISESAKAAVTVVLRSPARHR